MKKLLRAALAAAVAGTIGVLAAPGASAHATSVSGVAECAVDGTIKVTWTITNDYPLEASVTSTESTGGGTLSGLPGVIAAGSAANQTTITATQDGIPVGGAQATLGVTAAWSDYYTHSARGVVTLPGECTPPAKHVTPVAPEVAPSQECEVEGTVSVPSTEGIRYLWDGKDVSGTTLTGPLEGMLKVEAKDGYVLADGARTEFPIDLKAAQECDDTTVVTPVEPRITPSEKCDVEGTFTVPSTEGIRYLWNGQDISGKTITGPAAGTVTVEVLEGFALAEGAPTEFPVKLPAAQKCDTPVTPVAPTLVQSDECEVEGTVTIPEVAGVTYYVVVGEDEVEEIEPGTYQGPADVLIVAEAQEGYELTGTPEWEVVLTEAVECDDEPTPTTPTTPNTPTTPTYPPLAQTGAGDTTALLGGVAASLLALGGSVVLFTRRRALQH